MCGIIGITSNKPVSSAIINSLRKLEYRGYDSAGIATLSEGFIRSFQSDLGWEFIASCQKLSENFIREFHEKLDWHDIAHYQGLSDDFRIEFKEKLNKHLKI